MYRTVATTVRCRDGSYRDHGGGARGMKRRGAALEHAQPQRARAVLDSEGLSALRRVIALAHYASVGGPGHSNCLLCQPSGSLGPASRARPSTRFIAATYTCELWGARESESGEM